MLSGFPQNKVAALTRDHQEFLAGLVGPQRLKEAESGAVIVRSGMLKWAAKGIGFEKRLCSISNRNTIETDKNIQEVNTEVVRSLELQGLLQEHHTADGDNTHYVILTAEAEQQIMTLEGNNPDLLPDELSPASTPTP